MDDAYIHKLIKSWLSQLGVSSDNDDLLIVFIYFAGAVIIAMISYHIAKYILINVLIFW